MCSGLGWSNYSESREVQLIYFDLRKDLHSFSFFRIFVAVISCLFFNTNMFHWAAKSRERDGPCVKTVHTRTRILICFGMWPRTITIPARVLIVSSLKKIPRHSIPSLVIFSRTFMYFSLRGIGNDNCGGMSVRCCDRFYGQGCVTVPNRPAGRESGPFVWTSASHAAPSTILDLACGAIRKNRRPFHFASTRHGAHRRKYVYFPKRK